LIMEKLAASTVTSLAVGLMYLVLRRRAARRDALVLVALFAFGTGTWSTSSQALWLHAVAELAVALALWCMTSEPNLAKALLAGFAVAVIGLNRPPDVFLAAAFAVYALYWLGRRSVLFLLGGVVPGLLVLSYNLISFRDCVGAWGMTIGGAFFEHSPLPGLAALLFSPGRGLFVFSPFLLFLPLLLHRSLRDRKNRLLTICLLGGVLLHLVFYARTDWRAGHSYGPRYLLDLAPALLWLLAPVATSLRGAGRGVFLVLSLFSVAVEAIGAFLYTGISNQVLFERQDPTATRNFWQMEKAPFIVEARNPLMRPNLVMALRDLGQPAPVLPAPAGRLDFHGIAPCRALDTRGTSPLGSLGPPWTFQITGGDCAIPRNALAVAARVTTIEGTEHGTIRFRPRLGATDLQVPITAHTDSSTALRLPLSAEGSTIATAHMEHRNFVHLTLEVDGYWTASDGTEVNALRLQGWREGTAAAEIIPGREIVQRFSCPVVTLTDLAVPFATYGRRNRGHVTVILAAGDVELGRTQVPAENIGPSAWISLEPTMPIRQCNGRELSVVVRSEDGEPGSAVTAWTFPVYYLGELSQAGGPDFSGRSLGLEINRGAN
jgi:hypothetical protein